MHKVYSLNDLYARYVSGLLEKKLFEGAIFSIIQDNGRRFGLMGWDKDDRDDYLSSLYPRISRAIDAYRETGSSFETYLSVMVRLSAKEYRSRQMRGYYEEAAAWIAQIPDMYAYEHEPEYIDREQEEMDHALNLKNPRQLLILLLKCCGHVSMDFLEKAAPRLNVEPETLRAMIDLLRRQREKRGGEILHLRERVNRQFSRCIFLEKKLKAVTENGITAQRVQRQLETGRHKLDNLRRRLMRTHLDPSNLQIARLLGLSKGTVDSVLYTLKTRDKPSLK